MIPSLLQIPSAVSDSKLHSVLPNNGKGDFQFDRSTGATRINRDGLIEEVGYFSSELVQNGNFSELGSEIIPDPNFDTDSTSYWAIAATGGTPRATKSYIDTFEDKFMRLTYDIANGAAINRGGAIVSGKSYRVTFRAKGTANSAFASVGNNGDLGTVISNPTLTTSFQNYEFYIKATQTTFRLYLSTSAVNIGDTLDIDNISVKQVDPNDRWTLGTGWSYGENKVVKATSAGASVFCQQDIPTLIGGSLYKIQFDLNITSAATTSIGISNTGAFGNLSSSQRFYTTSGTKKIVGTYDNSYPTFIRFVGGSNTGFEITNISIVEVQGDRPRLSYDITNGVVEDTPHLLLENSSTNLVTFSNDYTQTFWTKHQSGTASTPIVTSNYAISPDGTRNADRVIFNLNQATDSSFSQLAASLTTSVGNVTNSLYIKSNTDSNYIMNFTKQTGANNLITVTNEWQRFEVTLNNTGTSSVFRIRLRGTESTSKYADVSIFGAQLEQQAFATSFIPTAGTTITRAAETCNNSKPSVNSTEGVLYCEIASLADDLTNRIISISDGTSNNRVLILYQVVSNKIRGQFSVSGQSSKTIDHIADTTQFRKIAFSWNSTSVKLYIDGQEIGETTTGFTFSANVLNEVAFDNVSGGEFYGKVKGLAVYNEALSESQLMQLTGVTASSIYNNFVTRTASFTVEALNEVKKVIDNL